jgi:hypothetical protein
MEKLNGSINKLIQIFEDANEEIIKEYQESKPAEKLNQILDQNEKIAEGVVALADLMNKPEEPKQQIMPPFPPQFQQIPPPTQRQQKPQNMNRQQMSQGIFPPPDFNNFPPLDMPPMPPPPQNPPDKKGLFFKR